MSTTAVNLTQGGDADALTTAIAEGKKFPLVVAVFNAGRKPLVLAQASPKLILAAGETLTHTCHTRAQLYDIVFGMLAVASTTGQATIGSIDTKLPKGAKK